MNEKLTAAFIGAIIMIAVIDAFVDPLTKANVNGKTPIFHNRNGYFECTLYEPATKTEEEINNEND